MLSHNEKEKKGTSVSFMDILESTDSHCEGVVMYGVINVPYMSINSI